MSDTVDRTVRGGRLTAATLLASLGIVAASAASAGSFKVNPVNIVLASGRASASLKLQNSDVEPVSVRVLTYKWTQAHGKDVYSATSDVISSPPIFTIRPGATQLIRIGLRTRSAGAAYRVILEEIPVPKTASMGIQVALRLDLPLYVLVDRGKADVRWTALRQPNGELILEARNSGALHSQVLAIDVIDSAGAKNTISREMGVVLPTSARRWKIARRADLSGFSTLLLNIRSPTGETRSKVFVEAR